ncbi:MAG TPA: hypothetical protein GXX57_09455 [Firmicutes bacterium]|nr:hypothetical protein [Bacillota bacterium]
MTSLQLKIELLSPTTLGAGEERRGIVDTDVSYDECGLPYIPGKRLKGLLRDAYQDVYDALQQQDKELPAPEEIFGERGARIGSPLVFGDAHLLAKANLAPWLQWLIEDAVFSEYDVLETLTSVRRQTAIDPDTGAAKEDTLRSTRVINPGQVFVSEITLQTGCNLTSQQLLGLALAASALKYMGTGRTRGLGAVKCYLERAGKDLSQLAIDWLLGKDPEDQLTDWAISASSSPRKGSSQEEGSLAAMEFSLTLRRPAVCAQLWGDSYTVATYHYIPGSTLKGAVAWAYMNRYGGVDDEFKRLFIDEGLKFLNAYPQVEGRRSLPIPRSIRKEKGSASNLYDLAYYRDAEQRRGLPRLERELGFAAPDSEHRILKASVFTRLSPHHARAQDRRFGRARGNPSDDEDAIAVDGTFFSYEALEAGQKFSGVILGSEGDLEFVKEPP